MNTTSRGNATRTEMSKGPIKVRRIYIAEFQKDGSETAELEQEVVTTSWYPSKTVDNDLQDNLFDASDFGYAEQEFNSTETRISWMIVPAGSPVELVQTMLEKLTEATLYRILSYKPILTSDQQYAITRGLRTIDHFAEAQAVRYPDNHQQYPGALILHNGNVQYRRVFFKKTVQEDIDSRSLATTPYLSELLRAELEGASSMAGQSVADGTEVDAEEEVPAFNK